MVLLLQESVAIGLLKLKFEEDCNVIGFWLRLGEVGLACCKQLSRISLEWRVCGRVCACACAPVRAL